MSTADHADPKSPLGVANTLVHDFIQGRLNSDQLLAALDRFDAQLDVWAEKIQDIPVPESYAETAETMLEGSVQGLEQIAAGVGMLRESVQKEDSDLAEQALQEIAEGQELLSKLEAITGENVQQATEFLWME